MAQHILPSNVPLSKKDIACYGIFGGGGFLLSYMMFGSLILYYFTDILGISMASAGVLLLVARIWDGINDPLMGLLIDKTHTRWGKNRPYIFMGGILMAIFTVLLFTRPAVESEGARLGWAYFTYIGYGMTYTMCTMSMGSLPSRLTTDRQGVAKLSSAFFAGTGVMSVVASFLLMTIITTFAGPDGDMAKGYQRTAIVAGLIVLVFSVLLSVLVKERGLEGENPAQIKLWPAIKAACTNKSFLGFLISEAIVLFGYYLSAGAIIYYCIYNLGGQDHYTPLLVCEYAMPLIAAFLVPFLLSKKVDYRKIISFSIAMIAISYGLRYITGDASAFWMTVLAAVGGLGFGCYNVLFVPIALDCAIYSEHETGMQLQGFFTAANSVLGKGVGGLAAAFLAFFLEYIGYVEGAATQTDRVLAGLKLCVTGGITVLAVVGLVTFLLTYKLKGEHLDKMNEENIANRNIVTERTSDSHE